MSWTTVTRELHEVPEDYEPTLDAGIAFYHPDDRRILETAVEAAMTQGLPFDLELRITSRSRETAQERDTLAELGAELFQGFLFGQPARELNPVRSGEVAAPPKPTVIRLNGSMARCIGPCRPGSPYDAYASG